MKKTKLLWRLLFVLLGVAGFVPASASFAQEPTPPDIIIEPPILPPIWNIEGLRIEYQKINVTIDQQVATTHIDQLFVNDNDWMLEGIYLFPLPAEATVSQLTMWVNGTPIEAKILPKEEARAIYDEIVRQLRDPALLEYVGSSAIQANIFPIPPHEERRIEIEYQQIVPAENGLIRYLYPQSTNLYTNLPIESQSIHLDISSNEAIRAIYSPTHAVAISREGEFRATVGFEEANVTPTQDFELYYTVSPEAIGLNLLSYKEINEDGSFLMLISPTVETNPNQIVAKDVVIILDSSGSMEGEKMSQAKAAAQYIVEHLHPQDRYNIISFSTGIRLFVPNLIPASSNPDYATFIDRLEAVGGTNISAALLEAVAQGDSERPLTIIFLTDGLATEGITDTPLLLDAVKQAAPTSTRLFAFGVGDDVDTLLLDSLTANHRGTTTYVRPTQAVDEVVSGFYAKVSTPVLADISIEVDGVVVEQLYPQTLPDLFAGTQLILTGRYRQGGPATITLRGNINGNEQNFTYTDISFQTTGGDAFIPRLWATRAIGHLLNEIRLHGESSELVQSIINLSIRYGIITPYTSYLIEEDDIFSQTSREEMAEEAMADFAAPSEVSGADAVDEASAASGLANAEAPAPMATAELIIDGEAKSIQEMVQLIGSKTFIYRDGMWIDTAYNPDSQTPEQVGFLSDPYFDLLTAAPDLGQYLALGDQLIVVYQGVVYQIVPGTGQSEVTLPDEVAIPQTTQTPPSNTAQPSVSTPTPTNNRPQAGGISVCGLSLAAPLMLLGLGLRKRRFNHFE